jgi:hypothetical protein
MHTFIKVIGDDLPCGGLLICSDTATDSAFDQLVHDLALAYPKARHCVIRGMDVVSDVAGDAE